MTSDPHFGKARGRLPALVLAHGFAGVAGGFVFALGVVASDGAGLGRLILGDATPGAALALWSLGVASGFGTLAIAVAVMAIGSGDAVAPPPGRPLVQPGALPIRRTRA